MTLLTISIIILCFSLMVKLYQKEDEVIDKFFEERK